MFHSWLCPPAEIPEHSNCLFSRARGSLTQELGRGDAPWLLSPSWPSCHGLGTDRKRLFTA